jgi:predicted acylesterase/phospholipase RssA
VVGDVLVQTEWQEQHKARGLGDAVAREALAHHLATYMFAFVPALAWVGARGGAARAVGSESTSEAARRYADVVIKPRAAGIGLLEFHQLDRAREAGRAGETADARALATVVAVLGSATPHNTNEPIDAADSRSAAPNALASTKPPDRTHVAVL